MRDTAVKTERGVLLPGVLFGTGTAGTVVINITGIHGNFSSNPFYYNIGDTLAAHGIDFVYALTNDAYPQIRTVNVHTGEETVIGSATENFDDMDDDVEAYLRWAQDQDHRHIVLSGHSLGVNKIIHYLSGHPDAGVEHFLFLSPANVEYMVRNVPEAQRAYIREQVESGNGNRMLPLPFMYWLDCTANTACQWLYDKDLQNVHVERDKDFSQAQRIKISGAMFIGALDNFTYGNPTEYLRTLNDHMPSRDHNQLVFIEGTEHTYRGKHQELADGILRVVQGWQMGGEGNAIHHLASEPEGQRRAGALA